MLLMLLRVGVLQPLVHVHIEPTNGALLQRPACRPDRSGFGQVLAVPLASFMGLEIRRWGTYYDTELANKDIMLQNTSRVVAARAVKAVLAELISYDVVESHRSWGKKEKVGVVRGDA